MTPGPQGPVERSSRTGRGRTRRHREDLCKDFAWFCLQCFSWLCRSRQRQQMLKWLSGVELAPRSLLLLWTTVLRLANGVITPTTHTPARLTATTARRGLTVASSLA